MIPNLAHLANPSIPADAYCFFRDGNRWACVRGDFTNLQESPAGFGETWEEARAALDAQPARAARE